MSGRSTLPLRTRLLAAIALALAASLCAGGVVAWLGAARSVQTELRAALDVARRTAEAMVAASGGTHPDPAGLLDSLRGNRHLRATLLDRDGATLLPAVTPVEAARGLPMPGIFVRLVSAGTSRAVHVPLGGDTTLVLETDPANEAQEAWDDFILVLLTLTVFAASAMLSIGWTITAALRPLETLSEACRRVGAGDFAALRLERRPGAPEVARLCDGFDLMAERLAVAEARDRRLHERMATLRDVERAAIARDLHDEIGPYLFAIGVDAANAQKLAGRVGPHAEAEAIAEAARNVVDATAHAQRGVRSLLGRLRPATPVELGLGAALEELLAFWRRRRPEAAWELRLASGSGDGLDRVIAEAGYRVVQEALGNAARHGHPSRVEVVLARRDGWLLLEISDDGGGAPSLPQGSAASFGLRGMAERVEGLGGRFTWISQPRRGVIIRTELPLERATAEVEP
jgi:two-component system sensor histidine kinase UhpB